jgi:hypothetical protein
MDEIDFSFQASRFSIIKIFFLLKHFTWIPRSNDAWSSQINGHNPFGYLGSKISTFQPCNPPLIFPGADNPLTHVPFGSTVMIHSVIQGSEISTFQPFNLPFLFPRANNPLMRFPFGSMVMILSRLCTS